MAERNPRERIAFADPDEGIGDARSIGAADIPHTAVGYDLWQTAHVGDDHRQFEIVGDLRHAALRGGLGRADQHVGREK